MQLTLLSDFTFRAHSFAKLIEAGNLNQQELLAFAGLFTDDDVFGIFKIKKQGEQFEYKTAHKDVALLFYYLQTAGKLPLSYRSRFDDDMNVTLAKLVLAQVLEIEANGTFVSGIAAQSALYKKHDFQKKQTQSYLSHLSIKAIEYVLQLNETDTKTIANRLYCYNTQPLISNDTNRLNELNETERFLGVGKAGFLRNELLRNWNLQEPTPNYHWIAWTRKKHNRNRSQNCETYKIYISPDFASFPDVFMKSARILTASKAFSFKTGMNRHGLLRPDKFVAYFTSYDDMYEAALQLKEALKNEAVQGVPFTAQLDEQGMISWGIDAPANEVNKAFEGASWRAFVTEKIAAAVAEAKTEKLSKKDAIELIRNKVYLHKIDADNWSPVQSFTRQPE